jgi:hypothetical protein
MRRKIGLTTRENVSAIGDKTPKPQMLGVDAILAVALVLDLSACGDRSNKDLVGHAMRTPTKTIPVHLAVALAQRQRPYPTVIAERPRLFPDVVEQVLHYVAQFPLQIDVTDPVPIVTILMTDCGFLRRLTVMSGRINDLARDIGLSTRPK